MDLKIATIAAGLGGKLSTEQHCKRVLTAKVTQTKQAKRDTGALPFPDNSMQHKNLVILPGHHHHQEDSRTDVAADRELSFFDNLLDRLVLDRIVAEGIVVAESQQDKEEDYRGSNNFEYLNEKEDMIKYSSSGSSSLLQNNEKVQTSPFYFLLSSLNQKIDEIENGRYDEDDMASLASSMTEDSIIVTKQRLLRCKNSAV